MHTTLVCAINNELRARMARAGISQVELSARLPISQTQLSARLRGAITWRVDDLDKVARMLDVSLSTLIFDAEVISDRQESA